ncbi:hypothetical protein HDV05_006106 [Chytridiales sp. JEL 0842]|nr:hypothetical protein HDV05_006106 [Chytridiales sp. JEL 0842]
MMSLHEVETQLKAMNPSKSAPAVSNSAESTETSAAPHPTPAPHDVLASHIYHVGFGQGLYSDLTVHLKTLTPTGEVANSSQMEGTMFKLHKLLAIRSPYLASLIQEAEMRGETKYGSPLDLVLPITDPNITAEGLSIAFGHLYANYSHTILSNIPSTDVPHRSSVLRGVLAAAHLLHLSDLVALAMDQIKQDISRATVVDYCHFVSQSDVNSLYGPAWAGEIRDTVYAYLCKGLVRELAALGPVWGNRDSEAYKELVARFAELPFDWLKKVVESKDAFEVPSDMERFSFAKEVVAVRSKRRGPSASHMAGEENVLLAFGATKPGVSSVTIVRKAPKLTHQLSHQNIQQQLQQQSSQQQQTQQNGQQQQWNPALLGMSGMNGYHSAPQSQERRLWKASN